MRTSQARGTRLTLKTKMTITDIQGNPVSGANASALDHFEQANHSLRCFVGDPLSLAQQAIAQAPGMTMAHALLAWLYLLGTEPAGRTLACQVLQAAHKLPANEREAAHLAALEHLVHGRWQASGQSLEDLSMRWPHDTLALQVGHQIDFLTGNSRMLRDRIARALPFWQIDRPAYHAVLGMYAFGLEETGDYELADRYGQQAVALERRDGWAWHAVAHVCEMQERRQDGIAWLENDSAAWTEGSFFKVHNWWHLALFYLGVGDINRVLTLVDTQIMQGNSSVVFDMIDASALLWRLHLRGVDVGDRWQALAGRWLPIIENSHYAFNDMHAMMALVGAGRDGDAQRLMSAQQTALKSEDDNSAFLGEVGLAATQAIHAFAQARYTETVQLLRPVRRHAHRFGGSHAQRDVIDLTLIEAAARDGQKLLADALRSERTSAQLVI